MIPPFRNEFDAARDPDAAFRALNPRTAAIRGTGTNDNAAAGFIGEYKESYAIGGSAAVTISNASPAVITDTAHGLAVGQIVNFTTTGGLPTGLSVGTNYYVSSQGLATNSYSVSTSIDNALAGTSVNTSSAGSGTHTRINRSVNLGSGTNIDTVGVLLTAGDWDVFGNIVFNIAATTTITNIQAHLSTTSITVVGNDRAAVLSFGGAALNGGYAVPVGPVRFSVAATTIIYLVQRSVFGTSTMTARGSIRARRVR